MALSTTWYDSLVDEPPGGDNTTGSEFDKTAIGAFRADINAEIARLDTAIAGASGVPGITDDGARVQQIAFSATPSPSADGNTLDAYAEPLWTPADGSGAGLAIVNTSQAECIKLGKLVYVSAHITYPTTADGSVAVISGLPYAFSGSGYGSLAVGYSNYATVLYVQVDNGATTLRFSAPGGSNLTNANLSGKTIQFAGTYRAGT